MSFSKRRAMWGTVRPLASAPGQVPVGSRPLFPEDATICGASPGCVHALMSVLVRLMMGAFSVEVDGRIVDQGDFQRRSAAAVVKILAPGSSSDASRERVMDHL